MDNSLEENVEAPRLWPGKNTCSRCSKDFIIQEQGLPFPGTKDLEFVLCPHCNAYNGDVFINGLVRTVKID